VVRRQITIADTPIVPRYHPRVAQDTSAQIDPDDVIKRTFTTVRRGADPLEVQRYLLELAGQLRAARERERELTGQLADAEKRATPIEQVDPSRLTALLGEETARVLDAARAAAAEIRAKAEENVARLLREARDEAQHMRDEAESVLLERTEEAEAEVERIRAGAEGVREQAELDAEEIRTAAVAVREAAEADAEQIREGATAVHEQAESDARARAELAEAEAERAVEEAKAEGREMVAEAQKVRQRMLDDLGRRRKLLRQQIEQLQAGRDRLLAAYGVVRETLDVVTEELHVALPEAKLSAEAAALRSGEDDHAAFAAEVEELSGAGAEGDDTPGEGAEAAPTAPEAVAVDEHDGDTAETEAELVDLTGAGAGGGAPTEAVDVVDVTDAATEGADEGDDTESGDEAASETGEGDETEPSGPPVRAPDPAEGRASSSVKVVRAESAERTAAIFERLRHDDTKATGVAAVLVAGEIETEEEPQTDEPAAVAGARAHPLLAARDEALGPVSRTLSRKLKRALSDEQNELLDGIRRQKGTPELDAVLPSVEEHLERYRQVARPQLADAAAIGAGLAGGDASVEVDLSSWLDELVEEIVRPLRDRLERAFAESASDRDDLAERVKADYREFKAQRVEAPAMRCLLGAANLGLVESLGPDDLVVWIVDDDGVASPDCEDNALTEPQPASASFPTGHRAPPLHDACRCIVVPVGH
jgi:cell division septum initiation protein DivIVA